MNHRPLFSLNPLLLNATLLMLSTCVMTANAALPEETDDRVELKTSFIKGNKELPQVLYIVPWQTVKQVKQKPKNMELHSLYGDIFQPVTQVDFISY